MTWQATCRTGSFGMLLLTVLSAAACGASDGPAAPTSQTPPAPPQLAADTLAELLRELADHYGDDSRCSSELTGARQRDVCRLWALQQMLTTTSARNGAVGGAFRMPYFWHWVEPNPRLQIARLPDRTPLAELPPPTGYERYKSFGHIDRRPALYLGDLAADQPRYHHPDVGDFATFGWCSEREMAFCALAVTWGYEVKIVQRGIHVVSRVRLTEAEPATEVIVDTTFDMIRLTESGTSLADWRDDIGDGKMVRWYNRVCHDPEELEVVRELPVSAQARQRLIGLADRYFGDG
jgi:hypothetical protein